MSSIYQTRQKAWTPQEDAWLRLFWKENWPTLQIGIALERSKNSVIGRAYAGAVLTGTGTLSASSTATSFLSASLSGVGVLSARYLTAPEQYTPGLFIPREAPQWFVNVARSIEEGLRLNRMPEVSTVADLPDVRENRAAQFLVTDLRMVVVSNGADWIRLDTGVSV